MKTKNVAHTPGPWEVRGSKERRLFAVYPVGGSERVADVYCPLDIAEGKLTVDGSLTGNLALIAAAPELLAECKAALKNIIEHMDPSCRPAWACHTTQYLHAAIAKAEGR